MPKRCIVLDTLQQSSLGKLRSLAKRSLASKVDRSEERHHHRMDRLALALEQMGQGPLLASVLEQRIRLPKCLGRMHVVHRFQPLASTKLEQPRRFGC